MTDQEIVIKIRAETKELSAALKKSTRELQRMQKQMAKMEKANKAVEQTNRSFATLATHIGKIVSIYATFDVLANLVTTTANFEQAMKEVGVVAGASAAELGILTDKARELGATTQYTATEVSKAMKQMAMSGLSVQQIYQGIGPVLNLAAAGMTTLEKAAEVAMTTMHGFGLTAADMGDISDALAKGVTNSATTIDDLGAAIAKVAPVARQYNVSMQETIALLGTLADAGLRGAMAGTQLKIVLSRLAGNNEAQKYIKELGIKIYDATGKLLPFQQQLKNVKKAFEDLHNVEQANLYASRIFGEEGKSAALLLLDSLNKVSKKLAEINKAMRDDFAGTAAKEMMDSLSGDFKTLKSTLESVALTIGKTLIPALREALQSFTEFLRSIDPSALESFGSTLGTLAKVLFGIVETVLKLATTFDQLQLELPGLGALVNSVAKVMFALWAGMKVGRIVLVGLVDSAVNVAKALGSLGAVLSGPLTLALIGIITLFMSAISYLDEYDRRSEAAAKATQKLADRLQMQGETIVALREEYEQYGAISLKHQEQTSKAIKDNIKWIKRQITVLEKRGNLTEAETIQLRAYKKALKDEKELLAEIGKMKTFDDQAKAAERLAGGIKLPEKELQKLQAAVDKFYDSYKAGMEKAASAINSLRAREAQLLTDLRKLAQARVKIEQDAQNARIDISRRAADAIFKASVDGLGEAEKALRESVHNYDSAMQEMARAQSALSKGRYDNVKKFAGEYISYLENLSRKEYDLLARQKGWHTDYTTFVTREVTKARDLYIKAIDEEERKAKEANALKIKMKRIELEAVRLQIKSTYDLMRALNKLYENTKGKTLFDEEELKKAKAQADKMIKDFDNQLKKLKVNVKLDKAKAQLKAFGGDIKQLGDKEAVEIKARPDVRQMEQATLAAVQQAKKTANKDTQPIKLPISVDKAEFDRLYKNLVDLYSQKAQGIDVELKLDKAEQEMRDFISQFEDDPLNVDISMEKLKNHIEEALSEIKGETVILDFDADISKVKTKQNEIKRPTQNIHHVKPDAKQAMAVIRELEKTTYSTHIIRVKTVREAAEGGYIPKYANGGFTGKVPGYDPTDSDKFWARLTGGEYVIPRAATDAIIRQKGMQFLESLRFGKVPAYAEGGYVGKAPQTSSLQPINLHIGGNTFPTMADRDIAEALRRYIETEGGL